MAILLSGTVLLATYCTEIHGLMPQILKKWKNRAKPTITPGVWSEWGLWDENCSTTCGIGVRRRVRTCSYNGNNRKRRCKGNHGELRNCDTELTCPINGGWSAWVAWDCSASCGGGVGVQKRTCTRPIPMFGGMQCEGPSEEDGQCNIKKCADQIYTLPPETAEKLLDSIDKVHYSFQPQENSGVYLTCNHKLVGDIFKSYPSSVLFWTKDSKVLRLDIERMQVSLTQLEILDSRPEDSGVYMCSMRYAPGVVKPLTISTVAVIPKTPNIQVREEDSLFLLCHGAPLSAFYNNLIQTWWHGRSIFKDFGNGSVVLNNAFELKKIERNHSGRWTCRIEDRQRGWTWATNAIYIRVLPPLPWYLKLLNDANFLITLGILIFVILVISGTFIGYKITKTRQEFWVDYEKWRTIAEFETLKYGERPANVESDGEEYSDSTSYDEKELLLKTTGVPDESKNHSKVKTLEDFNDNGDSEYFSSDEEILPSSSN